MDETSVSQKLSCAAVQPDSFPSNSITYSSFADLITPSRGAVLELIDAVAGSVQVVIELCLHAGVERCVVIGVARGDCEVEQRLILDQRVIPPIAVLVSVVLLSATYRNGLTRSIPSPRKSCEPQEFPSRSVSLYTH